MKKNYFLIIALLISSLSFGQLTINEIYYSDATDFVELKGPVGFDLTGWSLLSYSHQGTLISTYNLETVLGGVMPDDPNYGGVTLLSVSSPTFTISTKGYIVLRDDVDIIGFIAYGNGIQNRILDGVTSVDAGVANSANSLQLTDAGWVSATPTEGAINVGQTLSIVKNQIAGFAMYPNPVKNGKFSISTNSGAQKHIEIFSVIGKQVYSKTINANETIDISGLNTGFYVVKAEEEGKIATRKLIVN